MPREFRFLFDRFGRFVMAPMGMGPAHSGIVIDDDVVRVRLGWGFRATIPRAWIGVVRYEGRSYISRGAHGWRGRWLVNGSGRNLVNIAIDPPARAYVVGWPIRLRELVVSAELPDDLIAALHH